MFVVGLLGAAGAGKTTIAKHLVQRYGAKEYTLAYPLKKLVRTSFPELTKEAVWGTQAEKEAVHPDLGLSGRQLMQRLGQGAREAWNDNFWIDQVFTQIRRENEDLAVISDVRYVNEAAAICHYFGTTSRAVWRIENAHRQSDADQTHPSEAEWRDAPYSDRIDHDGRDLAQMLDMVNSLCRKYVLFPKRPPARL